jgi:hypothetical protein
MHGTPVIHQWETPIIHTRADEFSQSTLCEVSKSVLATTVALYLFSLTFSLELDLPTWEPQYCKIGSSGECKHKVGLIGYNRLPYLF